MVLKTCIQKLVHADVMLLGHCEMLGIEGHFLHHQTYHASLIYRLSNQSAQVKLTQA
jgi:hypothetical protein